jgi:CHAT domain-containing protein/predicted negative regulator of RcsB-dependent stress response
MPSEKRVEIDDWRRWFLSGSLLGLLVTSIFLCQCNQQKNAAQRSAPPDSLNAYTLKAEDRHLLAEWTNQQRDGAIDSLREWVRRHYGPFQSIGLRFMEQAVLFQGDEKRQLAGAKFDTARAIGEALTEAVDDSFLLRQLDRINKLDKKGLLARAQASLLFAQAEDLLYGGNYEDAIRKYEKAIVLARQSDDLKLDIDASYRLLYFLDRQGNDQTVIDDGKEVIAKAERAGYEWRWTLALCSVASAYRNLNDYSTALALLNESIRKGERLRDSKILSRCYKNLAEIYFFRAEYQQAESALQNLLAIDRAQQWRGLADHLQGQICYLRGEYSRAQSLYELALQFFKKHDVDRLNVAGVLNSLCLLNIQTGDYERALNVAKESLAIRKTEKNQDDVAESFSTLGFIYFKMDSLAAGIAMCRNALQLFQSQDKFPVVNTWLNLGKIQFKKGDLAAASEAFAKAENITQNLALKAEAGIWHGLIALKQARLQQASEFFSSALAMARRSKDTNFIAAALLGLSQTEQKLFHFDRAVEFIDQAIAYAENLRSDIHPDSVRVSYFATLQELFDHAILLALTRRKEKPALHYSERARARALRDALDNTALTELPEDQIKLLTAPIANLQTLQNSIPLSVQVIEYRLTPDTLLIWLVDRQKVITRRVAISSQALAQITHDFLQSLGGIGLQAFKTRADRDRHGVYQENLQYGRRLYQLLWQPIAEAIKPNTRLFIIPDGMLHCLPFGALVTPTERFFEEEYVWVKAPSLAILAENSSRQTAWTRHEQKSFLMIADDLPSVGAQAKLLSSLFAKPNFLIKNSATYAALREHLRLGANVVYFSVHAVADERFPMNSYIELYNSEGTNGHAQKTKVYARELLQLDFAGTRLVVLNACETASGRIAAGEGVLNLVRIFALRKVPVVVASLWQNDDRLSAPITGNFFQSIVNSPDYAQALHQAKLKVKQKLQQDQEVSLPYFWAVFEVYQNSW